MRKLLAVLLVLAVLVAGGLFLSHDASGGPADSAAEPAAATPDVVEPSSPEAKSISPLVERSEYRAPERIGTARRDPRTRVSGTIVRLDGNLRVPMANLEIVVFDGEGPEVRARTNSEGRFELRAEPGSRKIGAAPPNAPAWWDEIELPADGDVRYDRELAANRKHCVQVWRREGEELVPVGRARVRLAACEELDAEQLLAPLFSHSLGFETSNDGRALVLTDVEGPYLIEVSAEGLVSQVSHLDLSPFISSSRFDAEDGCLHVSLRNEGPPISGIVQSPDGSPLAGAAVFLDIRDSAGAGYVTRESGNWTPSMLEPAQPPMAWTDEQGAFTLPGPGPEVIDILSARVVVQPRRPNLVHHWSVDLDTSERDGSTVFVRLPAARSITLHIHGRDGKLARGLVSACDQDGMPHAPAGYPAIWLGPQHTGRLFSAPDGKVRLQHVGGPLRVGISLHDEQGNPTVALPHTLDVVVPTNGDADVRVELP